VADIRQLEQRIAEVEAHIKAAVAQANTSLLGLFPSKHHFAAHTGTAPWRPPAARSSATGCPGPVTASSTMPCT
jgi:transposase